tara:strand:- start:1728 stop:2075 length:348 start_codon:yes stop_codon:yes gene_type:complete
MTTNVELMFNPNCSKCIKTLSIIKTHGYNPLLIYYLDVPLTMLFLTNLVSKLDISALYLFRLNEEEHKTYDLVSKSENELFEFAISNPLLIQRPIAIHRERAIICRPPEKILEIL